MTPPATPQHCPTPRELDDLELLSSGALPAAEGFNRPGSPVTLDLPAELTQALAEGGAVELVDPEGLPLATVAADGDGLAVTPLTHAQYGPFRRLYLSPAQTREAYAGRTVVVVTAPLTDAQRDQLAAAGPVLLLALVGRGTSSLSAVGLLRATLVATAGLDAEVVAVPLADHGDPAGDAALRARVVAAYAGEDAVLTLAAGGSLAPAVAEVVAAEQPPKAAQGLVLFFTGLSGSGKSTLAQALMDRLLERGGRSLTSLDGDVVRRNLSAGLTFSKADRETNIRRIGWVAAEIARHGGVAVCSPIAPFDETRQQVREYVADAGGAFFLVHVATPLEECERRDRKGLYAKARRGEIPEFTGISSPYEEPEDADVRVDTTGRTIDEALDDVLVALKESGYLDLTGDDLAPAARVHPPSAMAADPVAEVRSEASLETTTPLRVLFVCTANICRSPYMDLSARQRAAGSGIEFASAGTHGFDAHPVDATMAGVLRDRGVDGAAIEAFRSRPLTRDLVAAADLVITAEASHRQFVLDEVPGAFRKTFSLGQLAASLERVEDDLTGLDLVAAVGQHRATATEAMDVKDPYRRGREAADAAADQIDGLLAAVLPRLATEVRA
ncbi:adenylyl-sulfate kinase [Nocardioides sp. GY 10113]|uniref:adenylyl-sulfate kinase n=1 Tax=Nocardioides sp. GY 10113 TaxID=2569761 RepID=UPI001F0E6030|nr:adenylyl-sulfate kinase [Nocardioides sp. GY 10113]